MTAAPRRATRRTVPSPTLPAVVLLAAVLVLSSCAGDRDDPGDGGGERGKDPGAVLTAPELGACRMLTPADVAKASDATEAVPCTERHTAETFAVGELPRRLHDEPRDSEQLGAWAYRACSRKFEKFLGADESTVMRTMVSWAWFRPSQEAWDAGARWYRCDVLGGGGTDIEEYRPLPETARGLLTPPPPDAWMACAAGPTVAGSTKVPCSEPHEWRAVTTIKLGDKDDPYPGDRVVQVRTRDFCSDSVGAWLGYPLEYEFGYTWFHEAQWEGGNRRSICWARTEQ